MTKMNGLLFAVLALVPLNLFAANPPPAKAQALLERDEGWQNLFDGKSLEGWNAEDLGECFKIHDGSIVAGGGSLARLSFIGRSE